MKKETLKSIILQLQKQDELNNKLSDSIQLINSSHTVLMLDVHTRKALYYLIDDYIGKEGIDIIDWWLYETTDKFIYDENENIIEDLTHIDDLIKYVVTNYFTNK